MTGIDEKTKMGRKDDRAGVVLAVTDYLRANGRRKYKAPKKKRAETKNLFTGK